MEIQLLGWPSVRDGQSQRKVAGRQGALLAALALHARAPVPVDRLLDVIWAEDPPDGGANALQQRTSRLRTVVDPHRRGDVLVQALGGYSLQVGDDQIDARRFEHLAAAGHRTLLDGDAPAAEATLKQALNLWRGRALEGFADEFWALEESRRLEDLRLAAIEDLTEAMLQQGEPDRAVGEMVGPAAAHPLRERLRGQLMLALYRAGRQAEALEIYDQTRRLLAEELGVDPDPQLQSIYRQILAQDGDLSAGPPSPARARRGNLPAPRGRVVGREQAIEQIAQLLQHTRLLTITGAGGAGKTTLALEAARHRPDPVDGSWLVELAPVSTGEAVVTAVADALEIMAGGLGAAVQDADAVARALAGRDLLLLLDNCEHLLPSVAPLVDEVLAGTTDVRILATSREPLGVTGEMVWSVPGLGVPGEGDTTIEEVTSAPAVTLLVERARAHTPEFALSGETAPFAATLVRRLDGIPLAVELAAARLRVLSLTEVADGLDDRFRLLTARGRPAVPRHRTLRAALDWSWDPLDAPLQRAWAALSVPAGRFDLEMASALVAAVGVDEDALDVVADLVDRSLLAADTTVTPTRYRMLESTRDYGRQRLVEQQLDHTVRAAHADVVGARLVDCHTPLSAADFGVDIHGLSEWLDDARTALRWAHERGERRRVQRIAGLLGWLWLLRGLSAEGLRWLDRGLGEPEDADPATDHAAALFWASALRAAGTLSTDGLRWADLAVRSAPTAVDEVLALVCAAGHKANTGDAAGAGAALDACEAVAQDVGGWPLGFARLIAGQLASATGDRETARRRTEEAVELLTRAGADWARVHALETLIDDAAERGDYSRARALALQGLESCIRQRYPELESAMLVHVGLAEHELGHPERAARRLEEAVARAAAVGARSALAHAHIGAGSIARRRGDVDTARGHLHTASRMLTEANVQAGLLWAHTELTQAAVLAGDPDAAMTHAGDALALTRHGGGPRALAVTVEALAAAVSLIDEPESVAMLLATAAAVRDASQSSPAPQEQRDIQRTTDRIRARIDDERFSQTWTAARARAEKHPEQVLGWVADTYARIASDRATHLRKAADGVHGLSVTTAADTRL